MGTFGEMTLCSSFFFLVCILIENSALSKMPFRGDAVIGKCISPPVTHIMAFSSRTTSASKAKTSLLRWTVNSILLESVLKSLLRAPVTREHPAQSPHRSRGSPFSSKGPSSFLRAPDWGSACQACPAPGTLGCSSPLWTVPARGAGSRRTRGEPAAALALPGVAVRPRHWSGASPGSDLLWLPVTERQQEKPWGHYLYWAVLAFCSTASEVL